MTKESKITNLDYVVVAATNQTNTLFEAPPGQEDVATVPVHRYKDLDGLPHCRLAIGLTEAGVEALKNKPFIWLDFRGENFPPFAMYPPNDDETLA